jgi:hypothetical protein
MNLFMAMRTSLVVCGLIGALVGWVAATPHDLPIEQVETEPTGDAGMQVIDAGIDAAEADPDASPPVDASPVDALEIPPDVELGLPPADAMSLDAKPPIVPLPIGE